MEVQNPNYQYIGAVHWNKTLEQSLRTIVQVAGSDSTRALADALNYQRQPESRTVVTTSEIN